MSNKKTPMDQVESIVNQFNKDNPSLTLKQEAATLVIQITALLGTRGALNVTQLTLKCIEIMMLDGHSHSDVCTAVIAVATSTRRAMASSEVGK